MGKIMGALKQISTKRGGGAHKIVLPEKGL